MMIPLCCAEQVTKKLKAQTILRNVSITLNPGEFIGLVGPNGAGKSTLLRHLCGLWVPSSGTVSIFGTPSLQVADHHLAEIGYVNQTFDLPRFARIDHLLTLVKAFHPKWCDERASLLREMFSLDGSRWIMKLSEGERQRVALVATLACSPRLLLLDEPASALDPCSRSALFSYLRRIVSEEQVCVLVSSHILGDLERSADRIVLMRDGTISLDAPLDDLRDSRRRALIRGCGELLEAIARTGGLLVESKGPAMLRVIVRSQDWSELQQRVEQGGGVIEEHYLSLDEVYPLLVSEGL